MKISCQIRGGKMGNGGHAVMKTYIKYIQEPEAEMNKRIKLYKNEKIYCM